MAEIKKTTTKEPAKPVAKTAVKADAPKIETKEPEKAPVKKAETKTTAAKAVKTTAAKKEPVKKEPVKKEPVKKEAVKKEPVKKEPIEQAEAVRGEVKEDITLQFNGKEYKTEELVKITKDIWVYDLNEKLEDFKSVELYVKPEECSVYYVINGDVKGSFYI